MLTVGQEYTTVSGTKVTILNYFPGMEQYSGDNHIDYNSKGEAFSQYPIKGEYRSPVNDIKL